MKRWRAIPQTLSPSIATWGPTTRLDLAQTIHLATFPLPRQTSYDEEQEVHVSSGPDLVLSFLAILHFTQLRNFKERKLKEGNERCRQSWYI